MAEVATVQQSDVVECEVKIAGDAATIYEFFTDAEKMARWMGEADLDARPGGGLSVNVMGEHPAKGEFLELDPPNRIVFSWGWEGDHPVKPGSTTVEITLKRDGDGTTVTLRHMGLATEELRTAHEQGWCHYMDRLGVLGEGSDPGPDPGPGGRDGS